MLTQPTSNESQLSNKSNNVNYARAWVNRPGCYGTSHLFHAHHSVYTIYTRYCVHKPEGVDLFHAHHSVYTIYTRYCVHKSEGVDLYHSNQDGSLVRARG